MFKSKDFISLFFKQLSFAYNCVTNLVQHHKLGMYAGQERSQAGTTPIFSVRKVYSMLSLPIQKEGIQAAFPLVPFWSLFTFFLFLLPLVLFVLELLDHATPSYVTFTII